MNKTEFLRKLEDALENELDARSVQENIQYYDSYIKEQIDKGNSEEEVLSSLGDPWVIARNIIDAPGSTAAPEFYDDYYGTDDRMESSVYRSGSESRQKIHVYQIDTWWKKLLLTIVLVLVLLGVIGLVTGVLSIFIRLFFPLIVILMIVQFLRRRR